MRLFLIVFMCFIPIYTKSVNKINMVSNTDSLLAILDNRMKNYRIYEERKIVEINQLKNLNASDLSVEKQIFYNLRLANAYMHYNIDSTAAYLHKTEIVAIQNKCFSELNKVYLLSADLNLLNKKYDVVLDYLNKINAKALQDRDDYLDQYFYINYQLYRHLKSISIDKTSIMKFQQMEVAYTDSLSRIVSKSSPRYLEILEKQRQDSSLYDEALKINAQRLNLARYESAEYTQVCFDRYKLYKLKGETNLSLDFLIKAVNNDLKLAHQEESALLFLVTELNKIGEQDRAYKYISFFLKHDFISVRLNNAELVPSLLQMCNQKENNVRYVRTILYPMMGFLIILFSVLTIMYIVLKKKVSKKLEESVNISNSDIKSDEDQENCEKWLDMETRYNQLQKANTLKDKHIGNLILLNFYNIKNNMCKNSDIKRKLLTGNVSEVVNSIPIGLSKKEQKELLDRFDSMVLEILPMFIEDFNNLLIEEEQIIPKGELLNMELRIFALIRFGITESSQIADILGYSVNTIYNYRSKVKNKAKLHREDFEKMIQNIGF